MSVPSRITGRARHGGGAGRSSGAGRCAASGVVRVSVLGAIATALHLDPSERAHLLTLAGIAVPDRVAVRQPPPADPGTERVLAALEPYPAIVVAACHSYIAWNTSALRLFGDLRLL